MDTRDTQQAKTIMAAALALAVLVLVLVALGPAVWTGGICY